MISRWSDYQDCAGLRLHFDSSCRIRENAGGGMGLRALGVLRPRSAQSPTPHPSHTFPVSARDLRSRLLSSHFPACLPTNEARFPKP